MNKMNKVRKGEVRIYKGMTYVAIPEIKEDHCAGCCFITRDVVQYVTRIMPIFLIAMIAV